MSKRTPWWRCETCGHRHRRWHTLAKCRWPRAIWIIGDGSFATIARCVERRAHEPSFGRGYRDALTVILHDIIDDARQAKAAMDASRCGGVCYGSHQIFDLVLDRLVVDR